MNAVRAMRWALLAMAIVSTAAMPATARDYPYCIRGCDFGAGRGDCSFASYQQCQASASGRLAYCAANPYFSQTADLSSGRMSRRRQ